MKADYCEQIYRFFAFRSLKTSSVVQIQPSVPVFLRFRAFSCFAEMFLGPYLISFVRCSDHELTHWSIIQEYLAASACFHEIVNKLYVFCFSAATHERINVTCFEREVPCPYIVWISRTFVGSKIHNIPFCKSDIFFAHHYITNCYKTLCNMYTQVLLNILIFSGFINNKTNSDEMTREMIHLGAIF